MVAEEKARKVISTTVKTTKESIEASKKISSLEAIIAENNKTIKKLTKVPSLLLPLPLLLLLSSSLLLL